MKDLEKALVAYGAESNNAEKLQEQLGQNASVTIEQARAINGDALYEEIGRLNPLPVEAPYF